MLIINVPEKKVGFIGRWKDFAMRVGTVQSKIFLTIIYFTVFLIPGVYVSVFIDPMKIKKKRNSYWEEKQIKKIKDIEEAKKLW